MQRIIRGQTIAGILFAVTGLIIMLIVNYNRSIWLDEALLSNNILFRTFSGLLHPLSSKQVAPVGYLLLEKTLLYTIPLTEISLRIPSLIAYTASVYLFYRITIKIFPGGYLFYIATIIFLLNLWMLRYGFEIKPYAIDVLAGTAYLYFYVYQVKTVHRVLFYSIMIFFSNMVAILLIAEFLCDIIILKQTDYKFLAKKHAIPAIVFSLYYVSFFFNNPNKAAMAADWERLKGFPPHNVFTTDFWLWSSDFTWKMLGLVIGHDLLVVPILKPVRGVLPYASAFVLMFFIAGFLKSGNKRIILLCLFPVAVHFILSWLRLYPADYRLSLYNIPLLIPVLFILFPFTGKSAWAHGMIVPYIFLCAAKYPFIFHR